MACKIGADGSCVEDSIDGGGGLITTDGSPVEGSIDGGGGLITTAA